jgi:APA family basic amino acid/polyamine antiporter
MTTKRSGTLPLKRMTLSEQLFTIKSLALLEEELVSENRLRRVLGPVQLTALGVGAIIGAGIFVLTGLAAHDFAGPGLMVSFIIAGLGACTFAGALAMAEFANHMSPGSPASAL